MSTGEIIGLIAFGYAANALAAGMFNDPSINRRMHYAVYGLLLVPYAAAAVPVVFMLALLCALAVCIPIAGICFFLYAATIGIGYLILGIGYLIEWLGFSGKSKGSLKEVEI